MTTLVCDFSTTTPAIRAASEVALLDCFQDYFEYFIDCVCGIPKITLEGALEDWQKIRARIEVLGTYELEWWVTRLRPILDEFVLTASGHPNAEFWKAIYKPREVYGSDVATGWIADLFPYLGNSQVRVRSHVFNLERVNWMIPVEQGVQTRIAARQELERVGVRRTSFPWGLSSAPVKIRFTNGSVCDVDLVAGFFAVKQRPGDLALSPVIGWSVAELPPRPSAARHSSFERGPITEMA